MTLEQEEKDRLKQLGKDRKLAEAVGALDTAIAEFTRVAGDENSKEEAISQAAANYRGAVERRNRLFDEAGGVTPEGGSTAPVDADTLREAIQAVLADTAVEIPEDQIRKVVEQVVSEKADAQASDPPAGEGNGNGQAQADPPKPSGKPGGSGSGPAKKS